MYGTQFPPFLISVEALKLTLKLGLEALHLHVLQSVIIRVEKYEYIIHAPKICPTRRHT
jgi:hypothetical protein